MSHPKQWEEAAEKYASSVEPCRNAECTGGFHEDHIEDAYLAGRRDQAKENAKQAHEAGFVDVAKQMLEQLEEPPT